MSKVTALEQNDLNAQPSAEPEKVSCTFICSRDTLDGAYPALILSINSRRLGMEANVFYTFMGINLIRKDGISKARFIPAGTMGAIPGMSAVASRMMRKKIDDAGIPSLEELLEIAQLEGVKLIACKMTIDMMGLKQEDLIEGVEIQTAEEYLKHARNCKINMFT
ncbi:MAG: DsrE/DsrF/DrsH-like family protein [Deltaproteobacteria bacterium]|jgi:peroxiredoxin family protein|nr:DsrE/DsrF/DrsH-like family protein [Deltaproteobacteria bacterium]MDA8305856.1 DsrE/DsrF/DrsH-like family protein [Deltaproteobacteria bacterium]